MRTSLFRPARALVLLGVSALALGVGAASAQAPSGGTVAKGRATVAQAAGRTTVTQRSNRAVIDWRGFDVGGSHSVVFDQPGRASATLNRVNSARASVISGAVRAPGTVVIQNTAGVLFTGSARVDVGGLTATSQRVDAARFQRSGALRIGGGERPGARVVNQGRITLGDRGLAALVGGNVENAGAIVARRGTVALASGTRTTIDLTGDGMVQIAVEGDAPGGRVSHSGRIEAEGGRVILTAGGAASALDGVINTTGVIRAGATRGAAGRVELTGRGDGTVSVGGSIDASGPGRGGEVTVTGQSVRIAPGARVAARGGQDGGRIRLGGDFQGAGPLRRAERLAVGAGATIAADGRTGRGGTVIAWSDGTTQMDGAISATGALGGGAVETSGRYALAIGPAAAVVLGAGGSWLLDPRDVVIDATGAGVAAGVNAPPDGAGAHVVSVSTLRMVLNAGSDVTITTDAKGTSGANAGDIFLRQPLAWTGAGALTLQADRDVAIERSLQTRDGDFTIHAGRAIRVGDSITSLGEADLALNARSGIEVDASIRANGTGSVALISRKGDIHVTGRPEGNVRVSTASGALTFAADHGSVVLRRDGATTGDNLQVLSDSGLVLVSAGKEITLEGGSANGRWVRLGSASSSSALTLRADRITVQGGRDANTFAEVVTGAGGAITMQARKIEVESRSAEGRVAALNGASLTMEAEKQTWDGPVRAGSGGNTGGEVRLAGAITASVEPLFGLAPGRHFVLAPLTPDGAAGSYTSTAPLSVGTIGTGTVEIGASVAAAQLALVSQERVGLGPRAQLTATGLSDTGAPLVVAAGRQFRNDAGASALRVTGKGARWLLYVDRFDGLTGAAPAPRAFDLYGRSFAGTPPQFVTHPGNRILYGERPVLTVTGATLGKTYGTEAAPGLAVTGLRPGDTLATALVSGPDVTSEGAPVRASVGSYATEVSATPSDQGYLVDLIPGRLTVTPAALAVTADDQARTYGAANPALTATYSGFVAGDGPADLDGAITTTATAASPVGSYAITASGLSNPNYTISYTDGRMTIDRAPLAVTVDDQSRTYGSANPALTATYSGFVLGEHAGVLGGSLATDATAASPVGSYAITAAGLSSGNYAISYTDGRMTIGRAPLTVAVDDKARTYGSANPALTATYAGFVLGETAGVLGGSLATDATAASPVGSYAITAAGLSSGNYAISYTNGRMTIDRAPLTVTVDNQTRTYGSANPALTASYSGFVLGEGVGVLGGSLATDATTASPVGSYAISAAGLSNPNYAITYTDGRMTVDRAPLAVTVDNKARTYGSANPALTATYAGFVLGEGAGVLGGSLATDATTASPVGSYAITAAGLSSGNYAITYTDGRMTIGRAALSVRTDDATRTSGQPNPAFTATLEGLMLGEGIGDLEGSLDFATLATAASPTGVYAVTPGGLSSGNYAIAFVDGNLTVRPGAQPDRPQVPPSPPSPPAPPAPPPPAPPAPPPAPPPLAGPATTTDGAAMARRFGRGVPPLTPGDASFRTTVAEAPPALASPFALTYSLGEIVQLAPTGGAGAQGFVPAAGGTGGAAETCGGPVNRGAADAGCARLGIVESYWTTTAEEGR